MLLSISRIQKWEQDQNISKLIEALQTNDDDLRPAICLVLGNSNSIHALKSLQYIEKNDDNEFVKIAARESIKNLIPNINYEELVPEEMNAQVVLKPIHVFQ